MIALRRIALGDSALETLAGLTEMIRSKELQESRLVEARRLWRSRTNIRADLKTSLQKFASGRHKCMYCGDNQGTDVDHYEPIAVNPLKAFNWLNHLLACSACNSHHKRDQFPLGSNGAPLLLDPTSDDPLEHLGLALSVGRYTPLTERGKATIEICQLNRDILCRGRQVAYDTSTLLLEAWLKASDSGNIQMASMARMAIQEQPFADVIHAMLRYAESPGAHELFYDRIQVVSILRRSDLRCSLTS